MDANGPVYRLVLFEAVDEPQGVRDLFCRVTGMHPTDALQWVAKAPVTWPRPLSEQEVRPLLDGLYEFGVPAEAWRVDQFPDITPPRSIHEAACLPEGLRVTGLRGEPTHWIPWDKFDLISAGRIGTEDEFRGVQAPSWTSALTMGLQAISLRPSKLPKRTVRASRVPRDPIGEVILVRRDPLLAIRVVENKMNYAYLGARLKTSAIENFPIFLADLVANAATAYSTGPTRAILEDGEPAEYTFPSSQSLVEFTTHRLLWSWYRRDRDAGRPSVDQD